MTQEAQQPADEPREISADHLNQGDDEFLATQPDDEATFEPTEVEVPAFTVSETRKHGARRHTAGFVKGLAAGVGLSLVGGSMAAVSLAENSEHEARRKEVAAASAEQLESDIEAKNIAVHEEELEKVAKEKALEAEGYLTSTERSADMADVFNKLTHSVLNSYNEGKLTKAKFNPEDPDEDLFGVPYSTLSGEINSRQVKVVGVILNPAGEALPESVTPHHIVITDLDGSEYVIEKPLRDELPEDKQAEAPALTWTSTIRTPRVTDENGNPERDYYTAGSSLDISDGPVILGATFDFPNPEFNASPWIPSTVESSNRILEELKGIDARVLEAARLVGGRK